MLSTHTQLTGTIATPPVCCPHCSKQYSSKTKMVQHIRKKHPEYAQLPNTIHTPLTTAVISATPAVLTTDSATGETVVTTDLLTQAMTELSQTLTTDYRTPQGFLFYARRVLSITYDVSAECLVSWEPRKGHQISTDQS